MPAGHVKLAISKISLITTCCYLKKTRRGKKKEKSLK